MILFRKMKKILIILMGVLLIYSEPVVAKNKTSNINTLKVTKKLRKRLKRWLKRLRKRRKKLKVRKRK